MLKRFYDLLHEVEWMIGGEVAADIWAATRFAEEKHIGQARLGGEPAINHVLRVGLAAMEHATTHMFESGRFRALVLSGILHDVLEDTETSDEELAAQFGSEVSRIVRALSHTREKEAEETYLSRVAEGGPLAILVKRFDRMDNFACLTQAPLKFRQKVIRLQTGALPVWRQIDPEGAPLIERELERLRKEVLDETGIV